MTTKGMYMTIDFAMRLCRTRRPSSPLVMALVVVGYLLALLMPTSAEAWWNDEWSTRKKISLDTSSTGAAITDPIGSQAVLVRLHAGNFRFGAAKEDGSDLRFVADDDKTPLKHHIEKYDALLGEALIWVNVPNVQPGTKTDLWLYYGNKQATATSDPKGTYSSDTLLVYHFAERGTPARDSSVWGHSAQAAGQPADGSLIGTGLRFDGTAGVALPASPTLAFPQDAQLTWSAWLKPASLQRNAIVFARRDGANAFVIGLDDGAPFVEITVNGAAQRSTGGAPIAPGGWHHVAVVATPGLVTLYLDGNAYASLSASLPALSAVAMLGGDAPSAQAAVAAPASEPQPAAEAAPAPAEETAESAPSASAEGQAAAPAEGVSADVAIAEPAPQAPAAPAATMAGFQGDIDELTIALAARPAGFVKAAAIGQGTDPSKFISFSIDEETASWFSGYFAVILKSVTFDGWVVIGILLIMAVASWMVMVEKNGYLSKQNKANAKFSEVFRALEDDLTALMPASSSGPAKSANKDDVLIRRHSSLYRIYELGAAEIVKRFPQAAYAGRPKVLNAEAIASIRSALDAGLVREMQQLNRLMVILTISISGGPFLGLLGTVIGVMVTFAAIAMSGDVNINAIAPGVAGALMATVAGLGVAIPALFGYNYLTIRIRDLTSDMQVFVDEFTTKMAEAYSANRPDPIQHRMAAE